METPKKRVHDIKLLGNTPNLKLDNVMEDPVLTKAHERSKIIANDQIIDLTRETDTQLYQINLMTKLNHMTRNRVQKKEKLINQKQKRIANRKEKMEKMQEKQDSYSSEGKILKDRIDSAVITLRHTFESIDRLVFAPEQENDDFDDQEQTESIEDQETKLYYITQIKALKKEIEKLNSKVRSCQLNQITDEISKTDLHIKKVELQSNLELLQRRLQKANKKFEKATNQKTIPNDPVHYEEGLISNIEKATDAAEKKIARSRVEAIEYGMQKEFSDYQNIKDENRNRRTAMEQQRLKLKKNQIRQIEKSPRKANKNGIADQKTEVSIESIRSLTQSSPRRTHKTKKEEKQHNFEESQQCIENLEIKTSLELKEYVNEYETKMAKLQDLSDQLNRIDLLKVKASNYGDQLDQLKMSSAQIEHQLRTKNRVLENLISTKESLERSSEFQIRSKKIEERQAKLEERTKAMKQRKDIYETELGKVNLIQDTSDNLDRENQRLDEQIQSMDVQMETLVKQVQDVTRQLSMNNILETDTPETK